MAQQSSAPLQSTPLEVIANVSRIVCAVADRLTGDRVEFPLFVAACCVEALKCHGIESRIMYGEAAWIEILENQTPVWAGCWGKNFHFWVATSCGEVVDLNSSVAHRKRSHSDPTLNAIYSPPMLWSVEVPRFYRYKPQGVAELDLTDERDIHRYKVAVEEIREKCSPKQAVSAGSEHPPQFPNEPILCPGRRLLDDSQQSFRMFDRALSVHPFPPAPF